MQILAQLADSQHGTVRDKSTLVKYKVSQPRSCIGDTFNSIVSNLLTGSQIHSAKALKQRMWRKSKEGGVVNFNTLG